MNVENSRSKRYSPEVSAPTILYDAGCGFCRVMVAAFLAWDRRGRLRPLALQAPTADDLLCGIPPSRATAPGTWCCPPVRIARAARCSRRC